MRWMLGTFEAGLFPGGGHRVFPDVTLTLKPFIF
jgi:hypothetical protein